MTSLAVQMRRLGKHSAVYGLGGIVSRVIAVFLLPVYTRYLETSDFGAVVFGFIDFKWMQKQEQDRIQDFENVFSFDEAFQAPQPGGHAQRDMGRPAS